MRALYADEHEAYRESFRAFLQQEVAPEYEDWRSAGAPPREVFTQATGHGFASMAVPEGAGGAGIDDRRLNAVVAEEVMRGGFAGFGLVLATHNDVCGPALGEHAAADRLAAFAAGSLDEGRLERVVGGVVADQVVVADGDRLVVFDAGDAARTPSADGIGMRGCGFADFDLAGVCPVELEHPGWPVDQQISLAVLALAGARHALELTLSYVAERRAFGVRIAEFENTRHALASVAAEIEGAQSFLDECVGEHPTSELRAAAAKLTATEIQGRAVDAGLQLHGGYGYMLEYPIAHAYADARFLRLHGGSSEAMKDVLARALRM